MTEDRHLESLAWRAPQRRARAGRARLRFDLNAAARRLMNAKRELTRLGVDWRAYLLEDA